jgi:hypothetical protein
MLWPAHPPPPPSGFAPCGAFEIMVHRPPYACFATASEISSPSIVYPFPYHRAPVLHCCPDTPSSVPNHVLPRMHRRRRTGASRPGANRGGRAWGAPETRGRPSRPGAPRPSIRRIITTTIATAPTAPAHLRYRVPIRVCTASDVVK